MLVFRLYVYTLFNTLIADSESLVWFSTEKSLNLTFCTYVFDLELDFICILSTVCAFRRIAFDLVVVVAAAATDTAGVTNKCDGK